VRDAARTGRGKEQGMGMDMYVVAYEWAGAVRRRAVCAGSLAEAEAKIRDAVEHAARTFRVTSVSRMGEGEGAGAAGGKGGQGR